jgi:hypothetical protein
MTSVEAQCAGQTSGTAWGATTRITAKNTASVIVFTTSAAEGLVIISGQIIVSTSGNLTIQGLKVTSQTLTVRVGSWLTAVKTA